jgi:hypothetical protein
MLKFILIKLKLINQLNLKLKIQKSLNFHKSINSTLKEELAF